ncbi:MAG: RNA polymerase sigma factor (sigma-70 family) [Crocinitomicaceae bacterium]
MGDKEFIDLVEQNKDAAFAYLVDSYSGKIYGTCVNMVRHSEDAEDLVQEVFTSIYLSISKFSGNSSLSTWIYAIALNKSKEFIRNKTRLKRQGTLTILDDTTDSQVPTSSINFYHPGVQLEDKELAKILFSAIDQLADNQREAYILSKVEGHSYSEIAEMLELSVSSIESLLFRAKRRLKELLHDYYYKN